VPHYRLYCLFHSPISKGAHLVIICAENREIIVIAKEQDLLHFCQALKRKLGPQFHDWSYNSPTSLLGKFDLLQGVQGVVQQCQNEVMGILFICILYCLVHECYIPSQILYAELHMNKYKYEIAYWLAKGNLPL
jgi:hypothetical protein